MVNQGNVQTTTLPRWIPLLGGILGSTTCGLLLYAFSVFVKPLGADFGWSRAEISLAFSICCLVFGLTTIPAGRLSDKIGPRKVVMTGSIILCIGFVMTGFIQSKMGLYVAYGLLAGFGGGMVYLPPIATGPKWWPDRKALATGFTVVGLGLGSFIMAPLATWIMAEYSWREAFIWVGIAMGIMGVLSAMCLQVPPAGWKPAGWTPPAPKPGASPHIGADYTHEETIRTPQFWLLYASYFCGSFAGLMVIGHIAAHGRDSGMDPMQAAGAVSALAITNAAVRILIGGIADKAGTKKCFIGVFAAQAVAILLLYPAGSSVMLLWFAGALIGWNYGAMFTLFPASCLNFYGPTAQGSNYGLLFSAWGLAGFAGPYVGGWLKDVSGTYYVPFIIGAAVAAVSIILSAIAKPPVRK